MRFGVLGTGVVGKTIVAKLVDLGHEVMIGSRNSAITRTRPDKDVTGVDIVDLGDITTARGQEMYLPLRLRLWGVVKGPMFNVKLMR